MNWQFRTGKHLWRCCRTVFTIESKHFSHTFPTYSSILCNLYIFNACATGASRAIRASFLRINQYFVFNYSQLAGLLQPHSAPPLHVFSHTAGPHLPYQLVWYRVSFLSLASVNFCFAPSTQHKSFDHLNQLFDSLFSPTMDKMERIWIEVRDLRCDLDQTIGFAAGCTWI